MTVKVLSMKESLQTRRQKLKKYIFKKNIKIAFKHVRNLSKYLNLLNNIKFKASTLLSTLQNKCKEDFQSSALIKGCLIKPSTGKTEQLDKF